MRVKIFYMADVFLCGVNVRLPHRTERLRESLCVELGCSLRFSGSFLQVYSISFWKYC